MAGVAVATAAIIIVLSVFNGFTRLAESRFSGVDPDLMVTLRDGKVFGDADSLAARISRIDGVAAAAPTLEERGLLMLNDDAQAGVVFKGVDERYKEIIDLEDITTLEIFRFPGDRLPGALLSNGVASKLGFQPGYYVELSTLRRLGRINPANPATAFFSETLGVDGIISIEQPDFDNDHIIVPLDIARDLLQYEDDAASAIEVRLLRTASASSVKKQIEGLAGPYFQVLDRQQQHAEAYRMIAIEKWVTFAMLFFILVIAAFNIISTLSLMVIEKRANMETMRFLGARSGIARGVFEAMGAMITLAGGAIGILLGSALVLAQQWGEFVKVKGDRATLSVDAYPVHLEGVDILAVALLLAAVAILASLSTRLLTKKM